MPDGRRFLLATVAVCAAAATACTASPQAQRTTRTPAAPVTATASCAGWMKYGILPTWARGGFHPPTQRVRYVIGAHRDIVGVLFGYPLTSPPPAGSRKNKILWMADPDARSTAPTAGPGLRIRARLDGSDTVATRRVDVGPSYVNLPSPGCWHLSLSWSGHRDSVTVRYRAR